MKRAKRTGPAATWLLVLALLVVPSMGVDCNETGDFIRGRESRTFAAAVASQIATGIVGAFIIALSDIAFGVQSP